MIARLLVGLDGSRLSEEALPHAAALARAFDAELILLRVLEAGSGITSPIDSVGWRLARAEATAYLEEIAGPLRRAGLEVRNELAEGKAAEQMVELAHDQGVDLIALCSHGEGGFSPFNLSGTAQKILAHSGLSVLLVRSARAAGESEPREAVAYRRILAPVDCSQRSEWASCLAASIARSEKAELLLAAAIPIPETLMQPPLGAADQALVDQLVARNRRHAESFLRALKSRLAHPGLLVRTLVKVTARVGETLRDLAREEAVDLVVVSAHGGSGEAPWPYGAVAARLIERGTTPLLAFQDQAVRELDAAGAKVAARDSRRARRRA